MRSDNKTTSPNSKALIPYSKPDAITLLNSYLNSFTINSIKTYINRNTLNNFASYVGTPSINSLAKFIESLRTTNLTAYLGALLMQPAQPLAIEYKKKKSRNRTQFGSNRTASLALPDTPKRIIEEIVVKCEKKTNSTSIIYRFFNAGNFVFTQPAEPPKIYEKKITIYKPGPPDEEPIAVQMLALEKQSRELLDEAELDDITLEKVNLSEELIKKHAARRVDLFFYLLVAVHGKNVVVSKDSTVKQNGCGSKENGTQACHCSMFPNVKLEAIRTIWSLFISQSTPTLSGTHFEETLNITMQLPNAVNAFDGHLEGRAHPTKYTTAALAILNKAAQNKIGLKEGMNEFLKIMNEFFTDFESEWIKTHKGATPRATKQVWEYEKEGTFYSAKKDMKTISDKYLYLMLRLNPKEIESVKNNPKLLGPFFKRIQEEIYISKPVKKQRKRHAQGAKIAVK